MFNPYPTSLRRALAGLSTAVFLALPVATLGAAADPGQAPADAAPKAKGEGRAKRAKAAAGKDGKPVEPIPGPVTPEVLRSEISAPPEFDVTIFATAQQANYPVFVAASP